MAFAYGPDTKGAGERHILIYGLGGSTFDASPVSYRDGIYEVKDAGDTHLGGKDFENRIADVSSQDFKRSTIAKECGGSRI